MIHASHSILINSISQLSCVRMMNKEKRAADPPTLPKRPERKENWRWPPPTPLPGFPTEDTGRILKQILNRLEAIEKRLENIEKMLMKAHRAA
jgi:hypothetical protein